MISAADDLGVATSGVEASIEGALENVTPRSAVPRVISPTDIPGDAAEQPHNDLSRALFNNDTSNNIPSQHLCITKVVVSQLVRRLVSQLVRRLT